MKLGICFFLLTQLVYTINCQEAPNYVTEGNKVLKDFNFLLNALKPMWQEISKARITDSQTNKRIGGVYRIPKKNGSYIYQARIIANATPKQVFDTLWGRHDTFKDWNRDLKDSSVLKQIDNQTMITYSSTGKIGPVLSRDFVNLCRAYADVEKQIYVKAYKSIEYPDVPERIGYIRAKAFISGFKATPHPRDPNRSLITMITHSDLKADLIPVAVLNAIQPMSIRKLIVALAKVAEEYDDQAVLLSHPVSDVDSSSEEEESSIVPVIPFQLPPALRRAAK